MTPNAYAVLYSLRRGRENARTIADLEADTGVKRRDIDHAVRELRELGYPVSVAMQRPMGLYLATHSKDLDAVIGSLSSRAMSVLRTRSAVKRTQRRMAAEESRPLAFFLDEAA